MKGSGLSLTSHILLLANIYENILQNEYTITIKSLQITF